MNLRQAILLRAEQRRPGLYDAFPKDHGIYIYHVFPESFNIALVGNNLNGDTLEELLYVETWVENVGFNVVHLDRHPEYIDLAWTLVESFDRDHSTCYTMIQHIVTWAGYIERYNQNKKHTPWPTLPKPEQLRIFFKAQ